MRKVLARLGRGGAAADIRVAQQHGGATGKGLERDDHASIEEEDEALDDGRSPTNSTREYFLRVFPTPTDRNTSLVSPTQQIQVHHFAILKICLIESAVIHSVHGNFSMSFLACSSTILIY